MKAGMTGDGTQDIVRVDGGGVTYWPYLGHGLAFNKDDQLFAGSVIGQTIYRVQIDSGEVDRFVDPPVGMADDIAFAEDGTMAWTAFLLGKVYIRRPNGKTIEVANGMPKASPRTSPSPPDR